MLLHSSLHRLYLSGFLMHLGVGSSYEVNDFGQREKETFIKLEFKNTLTYSINSFGVLPVLSSAHDCIAYSGIVGSKRKPKSLCFLVDSMIALIMHHTNYECFV